MFKIDNLKDALGLLQKHICLLKLVFFNEFICDVGKF